MSGEVSVAVYTRKIHKLLMTGSKKTKNGRPKSAQQMKLIGIRLQQPLIDRLKVLAAAEGLPYQTYLRKVVWDHVFKRESHVK